MIINFKNNLNLFFHFLLIDFHKGTIMSPVQRPGIMHSNNDFQINIHHMLIGGDTDG